MSWNKGKQEGILLVADDVLGGFFAVNGGAFGPTTLGKIYYFAPDNLDWEALDFGYSDFLFFCFSGNLANFYDGQRWQEWHKEVSQLNGSQGISCVPFLFTKEGKDLNKVSRKPVPIEELWQLHNDLRRQLNGK